MKTPLIDIRRLTRDYAGGGLFAKPSLTRALDDLTMTVEAGTIHGIVGESGCGKSTLARILMALDKPTSGDVLFDGEPLFQLSPKDLMRKRRDFQMVFQDPFGSLDPRQRVARIVAEPLHVLEVKPSRQEKRDRVMALLEAVGLTAAQADRFPHEFSGGQRQRIAIARALITEPKLVVADEAVSALDLSVQAQVLNLITRLKRERGVTFLFITHNLAVVDAVADQVGVMYRGRLVESGPARAVFERPLHPYTQVLAEAEPSVTKFGRPPRAEPKTSQPLKAEPGQGCAFLPRCRLASPRCASEVPALRSVLPGRQAACHHAETMLAEEP
ncbi:peptide ABC transporter ATP-binding protein [Xaviernesmea oryzae]|uniref:Peptide ABC transporter ATP-binding protein n=1 Tax=Xaviernesmea oryzae TaxID=464029 RepID=A0A1Q9AR28_9HYPH|nr:oligopeptide/dipeptide ABC transporter ATP-binding protein [Xaviernesmea oryzae]OLP57826.1 peptide ABC transporter ATP-binding protein [Xaviernesmea oryzae]SEL35296.1 peptide/nickel transport system ATP-binding protein [Xaviernesmea oryzae]